MSAGRCAGCGQTDSCKKVELHVLGCPEYLRLYREDPERCLDPAAEYRRYKAQDDTSEARAARRDLRLQRRFADLEAQHSAQASRWVRPKDILED
jgi:hypothetical protein